MTRRAFMRRDYMTCHQCFYFKRSGGTAVCEWHGDAIRWDAHAFGCESFGAGDDFETLDPEPRQSDLIEFGGRT